MGTQVKGDENEGRWKVSTELLVPGGGEKTLESFLFMASSPRSLQLQARQSWSVRSRGRVAAFILSEILSLNQQ